MTDDYDILREPIKKPEWDAPPRSRWTFVVLALVGFWAGAHSFFASRPVVGAIQAVVGVASIAAFITLMTFDSVTGRLVFLGWGAQLALFALLVWALVDLAMTTNDGRGRPLEWRTER